jgi:hypothetical protein
MVQQHDFEPPVEVYRLISLRRPYRERRWLKEMVSYVLAV